MMYQERKILLMVLIFFVLFLVPMCGDTSKDRSVSPDEEAIKAVLMGWENAFNRKDADGVIAFYHPNAQIMTSALGHIVSKEQYFDLLPGRFKELGSIHFGVPKINITEDKAKVDVKATYSKHYGDARYIFSMVRQNSRWLIMQQDLPVQRYH